MRAPQPSAPPRLLGTWSAAARAWAFPAASCERVVEALRALRSVEVHVEPLHAVPAAVMQASLRGWRWGVVGGGLCVCRGECSG